jgi:hypothetical protein
MLTLVFDPEILEVLRGSTEFQFASVELAFLMSEIDE